MIFGQAVLHNTMHAHSCSLPIHHPASEGVESFQLRAVEPGCLEMLLPHLRLFLKRDRPDRPSLRALNEHSNIGRILRARSTV